jgi:hypothetical protein
MFMKTFIGLLCATMLVGSVASARINGGVEFRPQDDSRSTKQGEFIDKMTDPNCPKRKMLDAALSEETAVGYEYTGIANSQGRKPR